MWLHVQSCVVTSNVRKLFLVRGPIDHFVSQIWGFDAIPKHAELVARLHWPDDNSNVVLLSAGVDRHVHCSLLQNFAYGDIWEKRRQNGRMPQTSRRISVESLHIVRQARSTHPSYCLSTLCAPGSVEQLCHAAQRKLTGPSHSREFPLRQESSASK